MEDITANKGSSMCLQGAWWASYVVGQSGNAATVGEFELLFPEVGKIASLLSVLVTEASSNHLDCNPQSCFNQTKRKIFNVISLLNFMSTNRNMYVIATATPLSPTLSITSRTAKMLTRKEQYGYLTY